MKEKTVTLPLRELSVKETAAVNGGFLGIIIAVAVTLIGGCATMPRREEKNHMNNQ